MSTRRNMLKLAAAGVLSAAAWRGAQAAKKKNETDPLLKLAVVGTGQISERYLQQGKDNPRARFVATCARTLESAKSRATQYGIGKWFDDYESMYEAVEPHAVIIATPSAVHAAPAIAALERGIHVLCEKPMATSFEDCQAMVAAAQKSGAIFLNMPYDATPAVRAALKYLNEETLGVFTGAEAQLNIAGHGRANWYYDRDVAGGVMLDTLVYPLSHLIALLGPARRVTGLANTLIPHRVVGDQVVESDIDDNVSLLIEWASGQQAILRALWGVTWGRGDALIYGRRGTLLTSVFGGDVVVHSPNKPVAGLTAETWNGRANCYREVVKTDLDNRGQALEHFIDCIQGKSQPTCGGEMQLHVHEILFKAYDAARTGQTRELKTTFTPWHELDPAFFDTRSRPI